MTRIKRVTWYVARLRMFFCFFSGQLFRPNGTFAKVHSIEDDMALASRLTKVRSMQLVRMEGVCLLVENDWYPVD